MSDEHVGDGGGGRDPAGSPDTEGTGPDTRPELLVLDVNETLSDLTALGPRFRDVGVDPLLGPTWFASVLRDGFALTVTGQRPLFADLAAEVLAGTLTGRVDDTDAAVAHVMAGFAELPVHPDVVEGLRSLHQLGLRLVTLSNGSTGVARGLLERNGIEDLFETLLSVEQAPAWKPATAAYESALTATGCAANRAMLVAVHPWDLHGAHQAGLGTAWVNRSVAAYPAHFAAPDLEATSLVDLAAQLGAVAG